LEGEGLDDQLGRPHLVEAAMEAELVLASSVHVPVRTAGPAVEGVDAHLEIARTEPLDEQLGVGMCAEHLGWRGVELPRDADQRDRRVGRDLSLAGRGRHSYLSLSLPSGIDRSTSSRRR